MKKTFSSEVLEKTKNVKTKTDNTEKQKYNNKENKSKKIKSSLDIESEEDLLQWMWWHLQ